MQYLYSFLFAGLCSLIAQIVSDNTKLTPGHITSIFTVIGVILSFFGIYDELIKYCSAGATVIISNFGHLLYQGVIEGYIKYGIVGLFTGLYSKCSAALSSVIIFSFIAAMIFKPKD